MHQRLTILACHIVVMSSIGSIAAANEPASSPAAGATKAPDAVPAALPKTVFQTDFSADFKYVLPHRFDTSSIAKKLANGVLMVHIKPGMYGASNDKPNRERAEYGQAVPAGTTARQSFRLRVEPGFAAPKRTLVAQFKPPVGNASPPLSLYLSNGGEVKYVDYQGSDNPDRHDQHHVPLASLGINLVDGQWHQVSMDYWRSDTNGYIQVTIDGRVIVTQEGYDSNPGGEDTLNARIGIYRDAMPIEQTVMFDDWKVEALPPRGR